MKNFGFSGMDNVIHLGTNGKMPEICAAMGLVCFERLDDVLAGNRRNHELYRENLAGIPGLALIGYDHLEATNWQYVVVVIDQNEAGTTRDEILNTLRRANV